MHQAAMQTSSIAQAFPDVFCKVQATSETKTMLGILLSTGSSQEQYAHVLNKFAKLLKILQRAKDHYEKKRT